MARPKQAKRKQQKPYVHWRHRAKAQQANPTKPDIEVNPMHRAKTSQDGRTTCSVWNWLDDTAIVFERLGEVLGKAVRYLIGGFTKGYKDVRG